MKGPILRALREARRDAEEAENAKQRCQKKSGGAHPLETAIRWLKRPLVAAFSLVASSFAAVISGVGSVSTGTAKPFGSSLKNGLSLSSAIWMFFFTAFMRAGTEGNVSRCPWCGRKRLTHGSALMLCALERSFSPSMFTCTRGSCLCPGHKDAGAFLF